MLRITFELKNIVFEWWKTVRAATVAGTTNSTVFEHLFNNQMVPSKSTTAVTSKQAHSAHGLTG